MSKDEDNYLEDVGGPEVTVFDKTADVLQALSVRVGPIYTKDSVEDEPGIWVEYQEDYLKSSSEGPVLIPLHVWNELDNAVRTRIARFNKDKYGAVQT